MARNNQGKNRKAKKKPRGGQPTPRSGAKNPGSPSPIRVKDRVHLPTTNDFLLVAEVERLHPECAPIIDYSQITAGTESLEVFSLQLYWRLRARGEDLERPVFMAFCHLNANRLTDYIRSRLNEGAYPLDIDEILSEVYFRFDRHLRGLGAGPFLDPNFAWKPPRGGWTLFHMLTAATNAIIEEQLEWLTASARPLPGMPTIRVNPPRALIDLTSSLIEDNRTTLKEKDLHQWVVHSTLTLSPEHRRVLHLKDQQKLSMAEIAEELDTSPMDAARVLCEAREAYRDRILTLLADFVGPPHAGASPTKASDRSPAPIRKLPSVDQRPDESEDDDA